MYVISKKDVNNILENYEIENYKSIISIETLQYYQVESRVCIVLMIETNLGKKFVIKLISSELLCDEQEEEQAKFSEFLRINDIPIPHKYKAKNKYVNSFTFENEKFYVTVEDYWGENLNIISLESTAILGKLLAKMHELSIAHDYHLTKGSIYRALISGRVGIDKIWESPRVLIDFGIYEKIKFTHEKAIITIGKMWKELPINAVHGDLGLLNNITIHNNQYGIIDFNLSGDEVLLSDMLITWYSSVYSFNLALNLTRSDIKKNRKKFFGAYISNRNLTINEKEDFYNMACIINGIYFNRFVALLANKGFDRTVIKMIPHIVKNYECLDTDFDIKKELQREMKII